MIIYKSFMVKTITYSAVLITWSTILVCYGLAVGLGHVPAWLPTISDCGVQSPEKYLFRMGLSIGATALLVNVILVYYAFPDFNFRKLKLLTGVLSSCGLAILASVNEQENNKVHMVGTAIFFSGYVIFMLVVAYSAHKDPKISSASAINKRIFALLGIAVLVAAGLLSLNWSGYRDYVAVCEWSVDVNVPLHMHIFHSRLYQAWSV
jgi:hypothetical protein